MTTPVIDSYLDLIPSANRGKVDFTAVITALVQPFVDEQTVGLSMLSAKFDIDQAAGEQLDFIGEWIGLARRLLVPIAGVFLSFDTPGLGFNQGVWFNTSYASQGIVEMDDGTYRQMLSIKALANVWDGSLGDANAKLESIFGVGVVYLQDNFDMTQTITVSGTLPSALFEELVQQGYIEFKPAGVRTI